MPNTLARDILSRDSHEGNLLSDEMTRNEWEAICRKCGKCCYEKVDLGAGLIRYTDEPCEHLDTKTNLCKVYHQRHEVEPDCLELTEQLVRTIHWMPEECAYVLYFKEKDTMQAVRAAAHKKNKKRRRGSKRRR